MTYNYKYQDFPGAPELTKKSQQIGALTALPGYIIFGMIWLFVVFAICEATGMDDQIAAWAGLISAIVALPQIFKKVRANANEKLQQKYIAKLNVMRDTDPAQYMKSVQELQRRQKAN